MAKVVPLQRAISAPSALDLYGHLLLRWPSRELVPLVALTQLRSEIEAALRPAERREVEIAVAALAASLKMPPTIEDPAKFGEAMAIELAGYPADIFAEAISRARRTLDWFPSIKEMLAICDELIAPRLRQLDAVSAMEMEHQRLQGEADRAEREAEADARREAEREARRQGELDRLRNLDAQARKRFGEDGPLPGDVQLADSLSATHLHRAGKPVSWQTALSDGEPWAAKFCRLMALAARVLRATERGLISWKECLDVAKLIASDEAAARDQLEQMETRSPQYADRPLESFWRALWKIHRACGLDTPRFPEDAAAAAVENFRNLTGLAALADTRAVLERQVREEWERQHPGLARILWRGNDPTKERNGNAEPE
jgi:hypothetical protein